jgi:hypothetical protein
MAKYTRKGEIERASADFAKAFGFCPAEDGWLRKALDRFGKKERTEARRQDIETLTKAGEMRMRAEAVAFSPGVNPPHSCPPVPCPNYDCAKCVSRYILGD